MNESETRLAYKMFMFTSVSIFGTMFIFLAETIFPICVIVTVTPAVQDTRSPNTCVATNGHEHALNVACLKK